MSYWFRKFSPDQPRDHLGRWTDGMGDGGHTPSADALSVADKAGLRAGSVLYTKNAYWVKAIRELKPKVPSILLGSSDGGDVVLHYLDKGMWEATPRNTNPKYAKLKEPPIGEGRSPKDALRWYEINAAHALLQHDLPPARQSGMLKVKW